MRRRASLPAFDFTLAMRRICEDLTARLPELAHIDVSRIAIACNRVRKQVPHGLQASLTPLRFAGGELFCRRGRHHWTIQRLFDESNREMLYILRFYLPRFMNQTPSEKLCTIVHELWHIGTRFDGDLRRFPGRCFAHSASEQKYDALCEAMAGRWLALDPPAHLTAPLKVDFQTLCRRHERVTGNSIPIPKLICLRGATHSA